MQLSWQVRLSRVDLGRDAQRLIEGHLGMLFRHQIRVVEPLMSAPALVPADRPILRSSG